MAEAHRTMTTDTVQDLVVGTKTVHLTKTECDKHVEGQGQDEAKDTTTQAAKEEKKDAMMVVEDTDIRRTALKSLGL